MPVDDARDLQIGVECAIHGNHFQRVVLLEIT